MRTPWKSPPKAAAIETPSFGIWVLHSFARDEPVATMPFARLEHVCANAAALVCGAVYADPGAFAAPAEDDSGEAALVARRTADGFARALADRVHTVLAWPWDHIATRVTWQATHEGVLAEGRTGRALEHLAAAYASRHREQLAMVLGVWADVAAGLATGPTPDLVAMGRTALGEFAAATRPPAARSASLR